MPAGSLQKLKTAVLYGADAVYLGTPDMSLRTKSDFTLEDVIEGVKFAHAHGVRVYLTLNLFAHNKDAAKLDTFIDTVQTVQPDGLIIADPGVFQYVRERAPQLPLELQVAPASERRHDSRSGNRRQQSRSVRIPVGRRRSAG